MYTEIPLSEIRQKTQVLINITLKKDKQTYSSSCMRAHALLTLWTKWRRESVLAGIKAPVRQCAGKGAPWPARAVAPSSPHLAAYTHLTSASWLNIKSFQHRVGEPRPLLLKIIEIHWKTNLEYKYI